MALIQHEQRPHRLGWPGALLDQRREDVADRHRAHDIRDLVAGRPAVLVDG